MQHHYIEWDSSHALSANLRRAARVVAASGLVMSSRSSIFVEPMSLARDLSIHVFQCELPPGCGEVTAGEFLLVADVADQRALGLHVFRGIASVLLERSRGAHTLVDVCCLAARIAAPPELMRSVGIDETVRRQQWATEEFLRTWWEIDRANR